jgi:hypothetical protein
VKTYHSTWRRISENISLKNETLLTDFSARALPMLNLIAVCSAATVGRDLTVMCSFHAFNATNMCNLHEVKTLLGIHCCLYHHYVPPAG